jgi:P2 family phage contractile tail tube protein
MANKITASMIPEVLNNFKVYNGDGDEYLGITSEMSLAELSAITATISGAGMSGTYDVPVVGHYDSINQEIPFRVLEKSGVSLLNTMKVVRLNVRGAIQCTDKGTGVSEMVGFRYVCGGRCTSFNMGSAQPGQPMNGSATINATYILIEVGGEKIVEIDKLNNVCRIDGVDLLEQVRRLC